jgi:HD-GYP domain-containing protein (c-di-GMP phosphodiesterase class II)
MSQQMYIQEHPTERREHRILSVHLVADRQRTIAELRGMLTPHYVVTPATVRRHHEGTYQDYLLVMGAAVDFGLSLGLAQMDVERLYSAAMFHDIGKAKIPLAVLDKPGKLDPHERALIETHPAAGYDILKQTSGISPEILDAVRHHHEYLDGSGYPDALCATNISTSYGY